MAKRSVCALLVWKNHRSKNGPFHQGEEKELPAERPSRKRPSAETETPARSTRARSTVQQQAAKEAPQDSDDDDGAPEELGLKESAEVRLL